MKAIIITDAMEACSVFVVLATKTYGAEGTSVLDTRKEARSTTNPKEPARACDFVFRGFRTAFGSALLCGRCRHPTTRCWFSRAAHNPAS